MAMRAFETGVALALLLALGGCGRSDSTDGTDGTDSAAGPAAAGAVSAARIEAGRKLFARCAGCHAVGPKAGNIFGPHLNGVLGRRAGSVPGYGYSPAMKASPLVWDEAKLVAFIRDPDEVVPGNKMRFMSFLSAEQAGEIVAYLATQTAADGSPQ